MTEPDLELNDGESVADATVAEPEDRPDIEEFIGEEVDDLDLFPGDADPREVPILDPGRAEDYIPIEDDPTVEVT